MRGKGLEWQAGKLAKRDLQLSQGELAIAWTINCVDSFVKYGRTSRVLHSTILPLCAERLTPVLLTVVDNTNTGLLIYYDKL